jgi:hypothetical protein
MDALTPEQLELHHRVVAFLEDLNDLSRRHGLYIQPCGGGLMEVHIGRALVYRTPEPEPDEFATTAVVHAHEP